MPVILAKRSLHSRTRSFASTTTSPSGSLSNTMAASRLSPSARSSASLEESFIRWRRRREAGPLRRRPREGRARSLRPRWPRLPRVSSAIGRMKRFDAAEPIRKRTGSRRDGERASSRGIPARPPSAAPRTRDPQDAASQPPRLVEHRLLSVGDVRRDWPSRSRIASRTSGRLAWFSMAGTSGGRRSVSVANLPSGAMRVIRLWSSRAALRRTASLEAASRAALPRSSASARDPGGSAPPCGPRRRGRPSRRRRRRGTTPPPPPGRRRGR